MPDRWAQTFPVSNRAVPGRARDPSSERTPLGPSASDHHCEGAKRRPPLHRTITVLDGKRCGLYAGRDRRGSLRQFPGFPPRAELHRGLGQ